MFARFSAVTWNQNYPWRANPQKTLQAGAVDAKQKYSEAAPGARNRPQEEFDRGWYEVDYSAEYGEDARQPKRSRCSARGRYSSKAASRLALSCNGELFFVFRIRVEQSLRSSKGDREACDHLIVLPILQSSS